MKLIITEKPSTAVSMAEALNCERKSANLFIGKEYTVTNAAGHLVGINIKKTIEKSRPFPYTPKRNDFVYELIASGNTKQKFDTIKEQVKKADEIIIATDPGQEGELIARLILQKIGWNKWNNTYRFWVSGSLTKAVVLKGMKEIKKSSAYEGQYFSSLARQHGDWIFGINLSQALIQQLQSKNNSIGRVQTPTLAEICKRHLAIANFKPEEYYQLAADFENGSLIWTATNKNKWKKDECEKAVKEIKDHNSIFTVTDIKNEKKAQLPPELHSLTSLQSEANSKYRIRIEEVMNIAQKLYEEYKCISYPRTDSKYLGTEDVETAENSLKILNKKELLKNIAGNRIFDDSKLTDHHGLIPTDILPSRATENEAKVYELVKRRFIGAFMPNYEYMLTTVKLESQKYEFTATGTIDLSLGWKELYKNQEDNKNKEKETKIPNLKKDDKIKGTPKSIQKFTTAPKPYIGGSIQDWMDSVKIGTSATRTAIIAKLIDRKYIEYVKTSDTVKKENTKDTKKTTDKKTDKEIIIPTQEGLNLYENVKDKEYAKPIMTAKWEEIMEEMRKKNIDKYDEMIKEIVEFTNKEIKEFKNNNLKINQKEIKIMNAKCPVCNSDVVELTIKGEPRGWKCSAQTYDAETKTNAGCNFVLWNPVFGKKITDEEAESLMKGEKIEIHDMVSQKTKKKFSALVELIDDETYGKKVKIIEFINDKK